MKERKVGAAVLVSGGGTNLQALIDAESAGTIRSVEIRAVISSRPDAYALTRAEKAGIRTFALDRRSLGQAAFEEAVLRHIEETGCEMVVLAGFLTILSEDFIRRFPRRILNVHPALIPSFCGKGYYGLKVHEEALRRGVKVTGATVHLVNEIPDGGEILLQKAVRVAPGDTPEKLQKRVMRQAEWKLLPAAVELIGKEILEGEKQ